MQDQHKAVAKKESKPVKTSVYLSQDAIESLKRLSDKQGTTMAEILRRAVATQDYLVKTMEQGGEVLIKQGKDLRQLVVL